MTYSKFELRGVFFYFFIRGQILSVQAWGIQTQKMFPFVNA